MDDNLAMIKSIALLALLPFLGLSSLSATSSSQEKERSTFVTSPSYAYHHDEEEDVDYRDDMPVIIDPNIVPEKYLYNTVFSDEIFFKPSTQYHHLLARQSLGMAIASFNLNSKKEDKEAKDGKNVGTLSHYLVKAGFISVRYDDYNKETSMYTVGSAIAAKDITYNDQKARLIAVAIRGGNYENEWQSNFTLGEGYRHEGFNEAASLVTDRVLSYIASYPSELPTKIWVTGFSRAGAVSNLVAANLNVTHGFSKDDIYAYTFAAPAAVKSNDLDLKSNFDNIFNIVGASDMIPQFVPEEWGFARYGIDKWLCGTEFDSTYDYKYQTIQTNLATHGGKTFYVPEMNFRLRMLYGLLLEFSKDQDAFVELLQPVFVSIMQSSNVNSIFEILRNTLIKYDNFSSATALQKDVIIDAALALIQPLISGSSFMEGQLSSMQQPILALAHEHMPELYLESLYSFKESEIFTDVAAFDYVILDQGHYTLFDLDKNAEMLTLDKGKKTLSEQAKALHRDYTLFKATNTPVLVLPHDAHYEIRFTLGEGESLSTGVVPYNRYFSSELTRHSFYVHPTGAREGTILNVSPTSSSYSGMPNPYSPSKFNADLGIERLGVSYHVYVLLLGLAIALAIILLLWAITLIHARIIKGKAGFARLGILTVFIIAIVEAETMFWFSSNLLLYNVLFKALGALCVIALYLLGKKPKDLKRLDKTILPAIVLFSASYILASVNIIACLVTAIVGAIYLIIYHLRQARPQPHHWLVYGLSILLGLPVLALFVNVFTVDSILYLCFAPLMVLVGFTAIPMSEGKRAASFLWIVEMGALGVYLFSIDATFIASLLFAAFAGLSSVLFAICYDVKKPSLDIEIQDEVKELELNTEEKVEA